MSKETLTHWKKLHNPDYLGAYELQPGEEPIVTIQSVTRGMVPDINGKKEECTLMKFKEKDKPMVLNVTNQKNIAKALGSPFIENWIGKSIQLYVDTINAFGEKDVEALRVRTIAPPKEKTVLDQNYKGWKNAVAAMQNGETTIEILESKYKIPPVCRKILTGEKDA